MAVVVVRGRVGSCLQVGMVGEKSTDKISHNTLTSCDHLLSMFYHCSLSSSFSVYLFKSSTFYWYIYTFQD